MALSIDTARALRSHRELTNLAEAIVTAPSGEPETRAIEWKSSLDLASGAAAPRFKLSKHVIAFANRHPDSTSREFEGCAYIIVGVEPQRSTGIPTHDPADVDNWLTPYLGTHGPQWSIDYVQLGAQDVLIVTVEPPRLGDRIFVLEKTFESFAAGRVFVRRQGKSVEPSPSEMRMLEDRLKRGGSQVQLEVGRVAAEPLLAYTVAIADRQDWASEEKQRLYAPMADTPRLGGRYGPVLNFESRSPQEYEREVEEYSAGDAWQARIWEEVISAELAPMKLQIVNSTDLNYSAVEVEVDLPEAVYAFFSSQDPGTILDTREPPVPWNTSFALRSVNLEAERDLREIARSRGFGPGQIFAGAVWKVQFVPVDVRPRKTVALPALYLAIPEGLHPGEDRTLDLHWTATSKSANGNATGSVTASLAPGGTRVTAPLAR